MDTPENLRYTSDHEWIRVEGDEVRVGITDFAQDALDDVVFVELPEVGREVTAGETIAEIESHKVVSEIYAPVAGTITAVNDELDGDEGRINNDPYGEGWLFVIRPEDPSVVDDLLDAGAYRALTDP